MKIMFCGPLRDFSGFAHASRDFLLTLLESEHEVVARALKYDSLDAGQEVDVPDSVLRALEGDISNVDVLIQMTTPNIEAVPKPGVCNALYTFLEMDRIQQSWAQHANQFDFIMVPCKENALALQRSGVQVPVLVVPLPCNKDIYDREYPEFKIPNSEGRTVFYNICQLSAKKGVDALLRAYYAAFADCPDEVLLVMKTYINMSGRNAEQELATVRQFIERVKQGCRIPTKLPPVWPIVQTFSDDEIHGLHRAADAYVCASRGEGWGIPPFDALGHGNTVISHKFGGLEGFISDEVALVYGGTMGLCYDMTHPDPMLFTGVERCFEPSTAQMSDMMRSYHFLNRGNKANDLNEHNEQQWISVDQRRVNGQLLVSRFDYRVVSDKIVAQIGSAHESWVLTGSVTFNTEAIVQ
jgi:glycosyltransferase involved in cell wall biosynthesis